MHISCLVVMRLSVIRLQMCLEVEERARQYIRNTTDRGLSSASRTVHSCRCSVPTLRHRGHCSWASIRTPSDSVLWIPKVQMVPTEALITWTDDIPFATIITAYEWSRMHSHHSPLADTEKCLKIATCLFIQRLCVFGQHYWTCQNNLD